MNELTSNLDEQQAIADRLQQDLARIRKTYKYSLAEASIFSRSGIAQAVAHSFGTETAGEQRERDFKQALHLSQKISLQALLQLCYDTLHSTSKDFASSILIVLEGTFGINASDYADYLEKNSKPEYVVDLPPKKSPAKKQTPAKTDASDSKSDPAATPPSSETLKVRYESALTRYTDLLTQKPDVAIQLRKEAMRHFIMQVLFKRIVVSAATILNRSDLASSSQSGTTTPDGTTPQKPRKK